MATIKTYELLIEDAYKRIKSNPNDGKYVDVQINKIIQWQDEILKLQDEEDKENQLKNN